jgi:pimeloyl-ACP methyl ester carboxylesterase
MKVKINGTQKLSWLNKMERILMTILSVFLAFILLFVGGIWLLSPGKAQPLVDQEGKLLTNSISEKVFIEVNGTRLGMFIKSTNPSNPVLLYLHGGMPDYFLTKKYPTGLENYFTVVWWEQRGSGISYNPKTPNKEITLQQMISDTIAVTNYLRQRFDQEKIYLMAHSGGSFIGIQTIAQEPDLYYAYIGVSQVSDQFQSELLAYEYMLEKFKETGNQKMVNKLENAPVSLAGGISKDYLMIRDVAMHSLGIGTTHDMRSVFTEIFLRSFLTKEYTLEEKFNLWRGKSQSGVSTIWDDMVSTDLSETITNLEVPVYFFEGVYDYTCSYTEAKAYFEKLNAPIKGFYIFDQSAHSPIFEEPLKVQMIIQVDVLNGKNTLADIH